MEENFHKILTYLARRNNQHCTDWYMIGWSSYEVSIHCLICKKEFYTDRFDNYYCLAIDIYKEHGLLHLEENGLLVFI